MKSVSTALEEIQRCTSIGPVTSTSSVSGSVSKTSTSGRSESRGYGGSEPKNCSASRWSAGPGVSTSRRRSTGCRKRDHACSIPGPSEGSSPTAQ